MQRYQDRIVNFLLFLFLFFCIYFPVDRFQIVPLSFLLICFIERKTIFKIFTNPKYKPVLYFTFFLPIAIILHSTLVSQDPVTSLRASYTPVLVMLVIPIYEKNYKFKDILYYLLMGLAGITVLLVLADKVGVFNVNGSNTIRNFVYNTDMGVMGKSPEYAFYYKVFFKTSPLFVILLYESLKRQQFAITLLSVLGLVFSGTRANVLIALALVVIFIFKQQGTTKPAMIVKCLAIFMLVLILVFGSSLIVEKLTSMMSSKGATYSDSIRIGTMESYKHLFSHAHNVLFGTGMGSEFYNLGRSDFEASAEMSFIELVRQIGIIYTILFVGGILYPLKGHYSVLVKLTFIGYLFIAATNPLLYSTTASIIYIYMYLTFFESQAEKPLPQINRSNVKGEEYEL